jgi:hypothetical protein
MDISEMDVLEMMNSEVSEIRYIHFQYDHFTLSPPFYPTPELNPNLSKGDLVLELDKDVPRGEWRLAIVQEVIPSLDKNVRKVRIKNLAGLFIRLITQVCSLEINNSTLTPNFELGSHKLDSNFFNCFGKGFGNFDFFVA